MQSQIQKTSDQSVNQSLISQTTIQPKNQLEKTQPEKNKPGTKSTLQSSKPLIQTKQRPIQAKQKPIQAKHKPIQAKQKPIQAKQQPLQRNVGNKKSAEIAGAMGQQYGVDTSNLQFNHNSSFPATVNADATIQGNKIDFAPGKDTTDNIKHEIGHHIVNTKRGTPPKADKVVNGQAVNTSDEAAADHLMKAPLSTQNEGNSIQLKANNSAGNDGPIQRITVKDSGSGEEHDTEVFLENDNVEGLVALALRFLVMHNIGELRRIQRTHGKALASMGYSITDDALWDLSGFRSSKKNLKKGDKNKSKLGTGYKELNNKVFKPSDNAGYGLKKTAKKSPLTPDAGMDNYRLLFTYIVEQANYDFENGNIKDYIGKQKGNKEVHYTAPDKAYRDEMNRLMHIQHLAQQTFGQDGVKVVARFYVEDEKNGADFPGLNAWGLLGKGTTKKHSDKEKRKVAYKHMKKGHDVKKGGDSVEKSPFVSTTGNLAKLMMADSPFNRGSVEQARIHPGQFYSERIDRLIYGYGNAKDNKEKMSVAPVANKIAFLAVNKNAYKRDCAYTSKSKNINADENDCCTLEDEHVLYAPNEYLEDIMLGVEHNQLTQIHIEETEKNKKTQNENSNSAMGKLGLKEHKQEATSNVGPGKFGKVSKHGKGFGNSKVARPPSPTSFGKKASGFVVPVRVKNVVYVGGQEWVVDQVDESTFTAHEKASPENVQTFQLSDRDSVWSMFKR